MADNLALAGYRDFEIYRIGFISNGNLFIKRILNAGSDRSCLPDEVYLPWQGGICLVAGIC